MEQAESRNTIFIQSSIYTLSIFSKTQNSSEIYLEIYIFSVNILFTFDTKFVAAFGDSGMEQVIALVKNAYRDKKLKKMIGTTVQVAGTKKKHTGALKSGSL